jgi:hypothetical protein
MSNGKQSPDYMPVDTAWTSQKTLNPRCVKLRVSYHPRYSLCSRAAIFLLWDGEYFYLHIRSVIKTSGIYLLTELTSVRLRLGFISYLRFPPLTWLSCVGYCHLLTLFGINMLFVKYVVDIVSQFRSEEKCFIKICLCCGNRQSYGTATVTNASRCMWAFNQDRATSNPSFSCFWKHD